MFGSFNPYNFCGNNILIIGADDSGKTTFISKIKDKDAVVLDKVDDMTKDACIDVIKNAGYRQVIVSLNDSKTTNKNLLKYDYIVIFNNKHMGWRDDIYCNFSLSNACNDFNEFSEMLDRVNKHECVVVSTY